MSTAVYLLAVWYIAHCAAQLTLLYVQVARCTKIIKPGTEEAKYVINVKQIAKVHALHQLLLLFSAG